jgi:uncharacterized protein YukJ
MSLSYGFVKSRIVSGPKMKAAQRKNETQYHEHFSVRVDGDKWDVAVNVGTDDADDLLKYKLVYDFHHPIIQTLNKAPAGSQELTDQAALPALDFMRSDILSKTGKWRDSDVMDGSEFPEPVASLKRLLIRAKKEKADVYVFGRFYTDGDGIHDTHMNQGSTGGFVHRDGDDSNDHNDIWQDGALLIHFGDAEWVAYFAAFDQQLVPTDDLGNATDDAKPIGA